jgi:hypothetical protein
MAFSLSHVDVGVDFVHLLFYHQLTLAVIVAIANHFQHTLLHHSENGKVYPHPLILFSEWIPRKKQKKIILWNIKKS